MNILDIGHSPEYWLEDQEPTPGMGPARYSDEGEPLEMITTKQQSTPLSAAIEVLTPHIDGVDAAKALVAAKCYGLLAGYDRKWSGSPYLIDAVESVLTSHLYNPETTRRSRTFTVAGKLDVRATEIATGAKVIVDHKTTTQDISDPNGSYWRQLVVESQATHYMLLEWLNGNKVDYALWDVVRKPGISPKTLTKGDGLAAKASGVYCGRVLSAEEADRVSADGRETPMMYAARLAKDCTELRPEWYFQRRKIPRLDSEVREYALELWGHGQDILATRASGRWARNSGACMLYGSPCKFLGLCSGHDSLESGKWVAKAFVHKELPVEISEDGRGVEVLTNSRIRTFQTCRRKHYLQYEVGIEKPEEEDREAIFFGSLFHEALEQFFLALQTQQKKGITCLQ